MSSVLINVQLEDAEIPQALIRNIDFFDGSNIVYSTDRGEVWLIRNFSRYFQPNKMNRQDGKDDDHNQQFLKAREALQFRREEGRHIAELIHFSIQHR